MKAFLRHASVLVSLALLAGSGAALAQQDLAQGFENPPDSAKPHTWWHWMNGNISREGITADLEAMKRAGIGGVQIFNAACEIPHGPVEVLSPEWRQLMHHAFAEADRLGLEVCVHDCGGWSSSGGPWVKPEYAMQIITTSEVRVSGPTNVSLTLPQPEKRRNFYRDIAVLAFPTPAGDGSKMAERKPKVSTSEPKADGAKLADGNPKTAVHLPLAKAGQPQYVELEFAQPFEARSLMVSLAGGRQSHAAELQVSDDGKSFRRIRSLSLAQGRQNVSFEPVKARYFRLWVTKSSGKVQDLAPAEISLGQRLEIEQIDVKAGYNRGDRLEPNTPSNTPAGMAIAKADLVDLTSRMDASGKLNWKVPAGEWTILRLGHTCTGKDNHPAPPEATGLEVDKLSREAMDQFWSGMMAMLIKDAGPLVGKSFNNALIDSYEVGSQNWTPRMREEFRQRRGYDPLPFLPAITGRVVESVEVTERFLWDYRRTIADLFADNYYGYFGELCHKNGLQFSTEPYGNGNFDNLQCGGRADIVMGEFWVNGAAKETLKLAASVAHTRGKTLVGAESFTATEGDDGWRMDPWGLKAIGDLTFCEGVNRYIFHRYAHQPWLDKLPGMTMGPWGTHFDRTETWWEPGAAWLRYVARCQYLLQSGRFVADLCYYYGESAPADLPGRNGLKPAVPAGYDYDGCDTEVLRQMSVKAGRLTLPGGMNYRVLVLPESKFMTVGTLRQVRDLVKAGATVYGPKPVQSPSLAEYPGGDREVAKLAEEVWGNCDGAGVQEHNFGKGRVIYGKPLVEVLKGLEAAPDFEGPSRLHFIHRRVGEAEVFFVSNQSRSVEQTEATFRVSGRLPELWHPDTGVVESAPVWSEAQGRTTVMLPFDPAGSVFVVFRQASAGRDHLVQAAKSGGEGAGKATAPKLQIRKAVYEATDGAGGADVTAKVAALVESGETSISANNGHFGDPVPNHVKQLRLEYAVDGKEERRVIKENESVELLGFVLPGFPEGKVTMGANGEAAWQAFQPGTYEFKTAQNRQFKVEVPAVALPVELGGAWTVHFPANWGAPERVELPKLISWTEHADSGVRYFSGTAEYSKEFDVPATNLANSRRLWLDLGNVKNFATVTINETSFEPLWKPPFRLEVTRALKPGRNMLKIKVTNLWPNRLIGDEQLPDDREWEGSHLKRWPDWLVKGEPRPNTGRFTFTTWKYYNQNSPLLESGLMGPVVLRTAEVRPLK